MIPDNLYLVLNLGLKSIRAIVFNKMGQTILSHYIPINTMISGDFVEQSPAEWWEKTESLLAFVAGHKEIAQKIEGITVTASSSCLVCIDENGNETYSAIMVSDKRAEKEARYILHLPQFKKLNISSGAVMSAYYMLPKIVWLSRNQGRVYKKTKYFLSPNDYLNYKLTGQIITDVFNAEKYHFDVQGYTYPVDLLNVLKIDKNKLPSVKEPGCLIGKMRPNLTNKFNLSKNISVVLSTYDAICAFFGSCPEKEGVACDVSGTVTSVRTTTDRKIRNNFENIFCSMLKRHHLNVVGASNNLGGGLIEWVKQAFYVGIDDPYTLMEFEASESNVGARGLIFLPYLLGERAPVWDNDARGVFWGIERVHTRRDFIRAVFESTAFITNDLILEIEKNRIRIDKIRVSGGLSRINLISQIKADVTGKKVELLHETETTSLGAFFFLLIGLGIYSDFKKMISEFIKIRMIFEPDEKNHRDYQKIFSLYKKLYLSSRQLFKVRKKIMNSIYCETINTIENL